MWVFFFVVMKQFEQLVYHPWLMPLEEKFFFPADCLMQLKSKLKDQKQKLTERTPTCYDWISEVPEIDDCFKQIYNSPLRTHAYKNNYVGVLELQKNVTQHFRKDFVCSNLYLIFDNNECSHTQVQREAYSKRVASFSCFDLFGQ